MRKAFLYTGLIALPLSQVYFIYNGGEILLHAQIMVLGFFAFAFRIFIETDLEKNR
jgi:hypothetical protein